MEGKLARDELRIGEMTCVGFVRSVNEAPGGLPGIDKLIDASPERKQAGVIGVGDATTRKNGVAEADHQALVI